MLLIKKKKKNRRLPVFKKQFGKKKKKKEEDIKLDDPHFFHINDTWKTHVFRAEQKISNLLS